MTDRWLRPRRFPQLACLFLSLAVPGATPAVAASAGLAVVVGNEYDGFLRGAPGDANAVGDKLEEAGLTTIRLVNLTGKAAVAGIAQIREAAADAGPLRIVYVSGFGMCANDDLVLLAEDAEPDQIRSGQLGDAAIPLSVLADAAGKGGGETLMVFDTTLNECTGEAVKAIKLPEKSALLVTTGIGGDVLEGVDDAGRGAFATAFAEAFQPDVALKDIVSTVVDRIKELTEDEQQPMLVGGL